MTRGKLPAKANPYAFGFIGGVSLTIGVEGAGAADAIDISIQLEDGNGADLGEKGWLLAYISDDAAGDSVAVTAPDTVAINVDGVYNAITTGKFFLMVSEDDGTIGLRITEDAVDTFYLCLLMPDGSVAVSDAITFA
jgi:hypothetical protein